MREVELVSVEPIGTRRRRETSDVWLYRLFWQLIFDVNKVYAEAGENFDADLFVDEPDRTVQSVFNEEDFAEQLNKVS